VDLESRVLLQMESAVAVVVQVTLLRALRQFKTLRVVMVALELQIHYPAQAWHTAVAVVVPVKTQRVLAQTEVEMVVEMWPGSSLEHLVQLIEVAAVEVLQMLLLDPAALVSSSSNTPTPTQSLTPEAA
jgi:hypothetical protein